MASEPDDVSVWTITQRGRVRRRVLAPSTPDSPRCASHARRGVTIGQHKGSVW